MFNEYSSNLDASGFLTKRMNYITRFKILLKEIYDNYRQLIKDKVKISKNENKIRDVLVDDYLSKNIDGYEFKKEEDNNLGRVDIFIQETLTNDKPEFIIECKLIDNKNLSGTTGKNSEYVRNGIQRFLTEHYFSYNDLYVNSMIGFIIEKVDIKENIIHINSLSNKVLNNLVDITKQIELVETNLYQSTYLTKNNKEFIVFHQMMDFSNNI